MLVAVCTMLAIAAGCATTRRPPLVPPLDEIVQMSVGGATDHEIITRLKNPGAVYPLSASRIIDLSNRGSEAQFWTTSRHGSSTARAATATC
jgi:hypothetical protein